MRRLILYTLFSLSVIVIWQCISSYSQRARLLISSPSLVVRYFAENMADLLTATRITLLEAVAGLIIAAIFSFTVMVVCFYKPKLMDLILPLMVVSQVVPLIVLAPFFIILLGVGLSSKIMMAAIISFFPIFVNFAHGYRSISRNIHDLMYIYDAPLQFRIRHVYFPLSVGSIMAGLKVSATLSVIGAIVAEFTGAVNGLGKNLFLSAIRLEPDLMMTSLILSALLGGAIFGAITLIERRIGHWVEG